MRFAKKLLISLIPVALIGGQVLVVLSLDESGQIPNPLATHWNIFGDPDGFSSVGGHLALTSAILGVLALVWILVVYSPSITPIIRKFLLVVLACVQLTIFGIFAFAIFSQVGLADARESRFGMETFVFILVPILFLLYTLLSFPRIRLETELEVYLRGIRFLSLPFSKISSVSKEVAYLREFGGAGLRVSRGKVAFLPSSGEVIAIETKSGDHFLIRSRAAADDVQRIRERISQ